MRVLSHPRVRVPLGFAASTWFSRSVVLPQRQGPFQLLASTTCVPSPVTLAYPGLGGWKVRARHACTDGPGRAAGIFVLGGLPRRRAAAGEVSSAFGTFSPARTRGGEA